MIESGLAIDLSDWTFGINVCWEENWTCIQILCFSYLWVH